MKRPARLACAALALACACARATDLPARLDDLVNKGDEHPDTALAAIAKIVDLRDGGGPASRRMARLGAGLVAARNGRDSQAGRDADALLAAGDPLARASALVIRAEVDSNAGRGKSAYEHARSALPDLEAACRPAPAGAAADCDYRTWWRALQMAEVGASGQGNTVVAASYAQTMLDVARRFEDRPREAVSLALSASNLGANGDGAEADRRLDQARRLARLDGSPWLEARIAMLAGLLHRERRQPEQMARDYEFALAVADAAGLARAAMLARANLSDGYLRQGRPARALDVIERALPVARRHRDLRTERALLHNAAIAHLALGRVAEARAELPQLLALWERDGAPGERLDALREIDDALTKAGDFAGALSIFHQEEKLAKEIRNANKTAAEAEVRARYDQDAQKHRIELMARDNALKTAQLGNRELTRRLWMFAGAAMALLGVLAMLTYLRLRELNRKLVGHEALLRAHSERDALTGLANRRQFREVMRLRGADRAFRGALLMVDIDHFKRINDDHGHAAGDRVLVEVSRRLAAAMRAGDLVARWGGEEFLAFAPKVAGTELDKLAERVRVAINASPVALEKGALQVTVSIGYAAFPLPDTDFPVPWEQAVNLADLSLYTAKRHGRDCAVGIVRTTASSGEALRQVEADLARARQEGRVTLKVQPA